MAKGMERRGLLQAAVGFGMLGGIARVAGAAPKLSAITVPLAFAVAQRRVEIDGKMVDEPVVSSTFIEEQLATANLIFGDYAIGFAANAQQRTLPEEHVRLETRTDRDALADSMLPGVANIFFVDSLRDVDDTKLHRMGVTWRKLTNLKKKYIIVAASARGTTMAHELGHYLGNDHTGVKNNLMSYDRDGKKVFLDATQGVKARKTALTLFAIKELLPIAG